MELALGVDISNESLLYKKAEHLIKCFVQCIIRNDLDNILPCWLHFRLTTQSTPIQRLKDFFFILFRQEMSLEIDSGCLMFFRECPQNMQIPIEELSQETREYINVMMEIPSLFFDRIDGIGMHIVYRKFKFNSTFKASTLWKKIVTKFIELLIRNNVNDKYLDGRAEEIILCFVQDEIAHSHDNYCEKARGDGEEWRKKNKKYVADLSILYNEITERLKSPEEQNQVKYRVVIKKTDHPG